ncbi:MAG: hypothetical protein EHM87_24905, partial [Burkholderiales bacterium]
MSFIILPPSQASNPTPADSDVNVSVTTTLSWMAGDRAASHNVYFGTESTPPLVSSSYTDTTYDPGQLSNGTTYYWRIDENNARGTTTGTIWSFTTIPLPGQASLPNPADEANNFSVNGVISWTAGSNATLHIVYFGTESPGTLIGEQFETIYDPPGALEAGVTYYWRIDEKNAGGTTTGIVWSFTPIVKIMPLGDSITEGAGSAYAWGYREPLYNSLINSDCRFDFVGSLSDGNFADPNHDGHYGWRADEILNGRTSEPNAGKLTDWLPVSQPDVILLHIGTNDITQGNQDANEVNSILNVIDAYETANNKDVNVILALIIDRVPNAQATTLYNNDLNSMAASRIANGDHIVIVNMQNVLNYSTDMADVLHPNDSGYAKMANVWYSALVYVVTGQRILICSSTEGGSVTQPGEGTFLYGNSTDVNITATPDTHFHFVNWTGTGVVADKVANPNSVSTTIRMDNAYTLVANFSIDTYLVTANAGANGTVDPTSIFKDYGSSQIFTATPATGYTVDKWQLDDADVQSGGTTYTLSTITAGHTVVVNFKILTYTISASAGTNGSIDPAGDITKDYGSSQLFTATPDTGYEVNEWTL